MSSSSLGIFFDYLGIDLDVNPSYKYFSQTLINNTIDGIFSYNEEYKIILWNGAMAKITGYTEQEVLGKHLFELFPFFVHSGVASFFNQPFSGEVSQIADSAFIIPEREKRGYFYANILPVKNEENAVIAGVCIFHEITSRKETEKKVEEQMLFIEKTLQTLPHYIYIYDLQHGQVVFYNRNIENLLGFSLEDHRNQGDWLVAAAVHPDDAAKMVQRREEFRHAQDQEIIETEFRVRNAQQEWRWICARGTVFKRTPDGEVWQYISTLEDITSKKTDQLLLANIVNRSMVGINVYRAVRNTRNEIVDFNYVLINPASEKILGRTHEDLRGKSMLKEFPGTGETVFELYKNTVETGESFDKEQWYEYEDFRNWFRILGVRLDECLVATIEVITAQKQTLRQIEDQSRFIEGVINATPNLIYLYDLKEQKNVFANRDIFNMLGYTPEEVKAMGESIASRLIHPDDFPKYVSKVEKLKTAKDGEVIESEYRIRHCNGQYRWLRMRQSVYKRAKDGRPVQTIGIGEDITTRRKNEILLERVLNNSLDGIVAAEAIRNETGEIIDFRYLLINKNGQKLLGLSEQEVVGGRMLTLFPHLKQEGLFDQYCQVANTGIPTDVEVFYPFDRLNHWFRIMVVPFEQGIVITFSDITGNKTAHLKLQEAYQELQEAKEELEKKVEERTAELKRKNEELLRTNTDLDNFIYTASHDLKAPISNIEGLVGILNKISPDDRKIKEVLNYINQSVDRFKSTLKDLTDIAKSQSEDHTTTETIFIKELLNLIQEDIHDLISSTEAIIEEDLQVPQIHFSRKNFRSILYNLISNGIKYRSPDRKPVVKVSTYSHHSKYTVLLVSDNGLGIPEKDIPKVFSMFKRLHSHVEGTGVGLYLVKRVVENAGGRIELESKEGEGSTFRIYLPLDN